MNIFLGHLDVNKMISAFPITYYVLDGDVFSVQNSCLEIGLPELLPPAKKAPNGFLIVLNSSPSVGSAMLRSGDSGMMSFLKTSDVALELREEARFLSKFCGSQLSPSPPPRLRWKARNG